VRIDVAFWNSSSAFAFNYCLISIAYASLSLAGESMRRNALLLVMAVTLFLSAQANAQELVDKRDQEPKPIVAVLENAETRANRIKAIEEVRSMENRILRFQDSEVKIRTTILLADLLWVRGKDEPGARLLFLKADELIRNVRISKSDEPASRNEKNRDTSAVSLSILGTLKSLLFKKVYPHDAALGQRLSRDYGLGDGSPSDIASLDNNEVSALIRRGQLASATKSLQNRINDNLSGRVSLHSFLKLLFELRAQDADAADRLFIEAMLKMSGQPNVTANDVLVMGNYLFASRFMSATLLKDSRMFGTSPIQLGDVVVEADVAQVRAGNSTPATGAYIGTATQIIERGSYDPEETKRRAAAAHLLLPHAQAFAPEFVPRLLSIQRGPGIDFSPRRTNPLPLTADGKVNLNSVLESVDAIPTSKLRDQYVLRTFSVLYARGELDAALTVGDKMEDLTGRNQLVSLISFARGVKSLEAGEIEIAQMSLKRATSSLQRFLLRLGLARLYLKQHDEPAAGTLLNEAINDIRDHGDNLQKPYLILSAVEILASFDLRAATDRLKDAIKAFNALETPLKTSFGSFREIVSVGDSSAAFDFRISGVPYGRLVGTLKFLSSDPQAVKAVLFELRDERMLSEGILAFAYNLLR
jgi:tetratricopeptide (TPR) repeat protein